MSVMTFRPTADPFGIASTFPEKARRAAPSTLNLQLLDIPIREVLSSWDQLCDAPLDRWADVPRVPIINRSYPGTPAEAFDYVCDVLQVNRTEVFDAVDVQERTYYNWQNKPDTRPRTGSLGRLWPMVDALFHLQEAHPNIAGWYHATPAAQAAFKAGDINRLLQLELEYSNAHSVSLTVARVPAPHFGDPGDLANDTDTVDLIPSKVRAPRIRMGARRRAKVPPGRAAIDEDQ